LEEGVGGGRYRKKKGVIMEANVGQGGWKVSQGTIVLTRERGRNQAKESLIVTHNQCLRWGGLERKERLEIHEVLKTENQCLLQSG